MNNQEKAYFEELKRHRTQFADMLEHPDYNGVKNSVIEKYTDQAHFIYELLQNADDAKATSVRFVLYKDKLIFAHNGTRRFTISNPATTSEDSAIGANGDINAITAVGNSNKQKASIGKFGVGFKAVFQYTSTPHIYDPNVFFKIERFIVPSLLESDYPGRQSDETLFVFPFDHQTRKSEEAYEDISEKLRNLEYPLLFLTSLKDISLEIPGALGLYGKSILQTQRFGETLAELVCLTQNDGDEFYDDKLWLFSRKTEDVLTYSVGFFVDDKGNLTPRQHGAFCFFPTREETGLSFIIHAPFLLTDSREGIRAGIPYNIEMVDMLAELAADSLLYLKVIGQAAGYQLINDDIFDIIPYDENKSTFGAITDKRRISFKPLYTTIKRKMESEAVLPAINGYVSAENAYWAFVPQIAKLFSDEQLASICGNKSAQWIFTSFGRQDTLRKNKALTEYIDSIIQAWLDEDKVINGIKPAFIESQSINWLHSFYEWVAREKGRTELIKAKSVFLNQDKKAVSVFDSQKHIVLFLPTETPGYNMVFPELLKNADTAELLKTLGVKRPTLHDEVYNHILPRYTGNSEGIDTRQDFVKFFKYFREHPQTEVNELIKVIKDIAFVYYRSASDPITRRGKADGLYLPNDVTVQWFQSKPVTKFVDLEGYIKLVGEGFKDELIRFLSELGAKDEPKVLYRELSWEEAYKIRDYWPRSTRGRTWEEKYIDGCAELVERIIDSKDDGLSFLLWYQLLKLVENGYSNNLRSVFQGTYRYSYYGTQIDYFESSEAAILRTRPWLLDTNRAFVSAKEITRQSLSSQYSMENDAAVELLQLLSINDTVDEIEESNIEEDEYADIPPEVLEQAMKEAAERYRAEKRRQEAILHPDNVEDEDDDATTDNPIITRVAKEITKRAVSAPKRTEGNMTESVESPDGSDEDDYTKPSVDFNKRIEQAKERSANEIAEIARDEELRQRVLSSSKYTFGWFKALLEMESISNGELNANSREISISFSRVEHELGTMRTLILKYPNRYIPQFMEDHADIPLELHFASRPTVKVAIEVVNVKEYTLRARLRTNAEITGIDLSLVTEARIEAKNPVFLIDELRKAFERLGYEDSYDMQDNLCDNIEFVFGPPGTGKTTHLAQKVIIPLMCKPKDMKVLVLAPTNKAADVLVRRIMETLGDDRSYEEWLVRFGTINDKVIEESVVSRDKTFDIRNFPRNVTVTTIARFPYDYFLPNENTRLHINALKWDYIIIDEASMIPLANIVYSLYKKTPEKFIIAGDPFQIEPITAVDIWKNENIYTMVELKSFTEPSTIPHSYNVELLTTQYRSIPEIGEIFSRFAYGGVLKHNRTSNSRRSLPFGGSIDIEPLNIVKFPVSKYESIFRPKRLQSKSNYQVYSALFAFELVKYLCSLMEITDENEQLRIGLIAPYRAQADLINRLIAHTTLPGNVDVQVGTIHGFQGDECDIIIALFNPPPKIAPPSKSREMFLNKLNIINVSISRSRDYLFVIMPDDNTQNVENLTLLKKVEQLCKEQPQWVEYQSHELEELIFGSSSYIEDHSFSTSHQIVNVYGKPEKKYEVRSEDNAVDVQIQESN